MSSPVICRPRSSMASPSAAFFRSRRTATNTILWLTSILQTLMVVIGTEDISNHSIPVITAFTKNQTAKAGETTSLTCSMKGVPEPIITWTRPSDLGPVILPANDSRISVSLSGRLTIENVSLDDSGTYYCVGRNSLGSFRASATIEVFSKPLFTISPLNVTAVVGRLVMLTCAVRGHPIPTIFWSRHAGPIDHLVFPSSDHGRFTVKKSGTLIIDSVRHEDAGRYQCQAANSQGTAAVTAAITVNDPPSPPAFISGPENQTVTEDDSVVFQCRVTGTPEPIITWYHNGELIPDNKSRVNISAEGELHIDDVRQTDSGKYTCKVINSEGEISRSASLSVLEKLVQPVIVRAPVDQMVRIGVDVHMACEADGTPRPIISWEHDGQPITSADIRMIISSEGPLHIRDARESDSGIYRCKASNTAGEKIQVARLSVQDPPIILNGPENQEVFVGQEVQMSCNVSGSSSITWVHDGTVLMIMASDRSPVSFVPSQKVRMNEEGTLTLLDIQTRDAGEYMCSAANAAGQTTKSAALTVQESTAPRKILTGAENEDSPIIVNGPKNQEVFVGAEVQMPCEVSGSSIIDWFHDGQLLTRKYPSGLPVSLATSGRVRMDEEGTLILLDIQTTDAGKYTCRAGLTIQNAVLTVKELIKSPPKILTGPENQDTSVGADVQMVCEASGSPQPIIHWFQDSRPIVLTGGRVTMTTNGSLSISAIRSSDSGMYTCKASNTEGEITQSATLIVQELIISSPKILTGPENQDTSVGADVQMACETSGSPQPIIHWFQDSRPIVLTGGRVTMATNGSLSISAIRSSDSGMYTCKAANTEGEITQSAILTVQVKPCPCLEAPHNGQVTLYGVHPGDTSRFSCQSNHTLVGSDLLRCGLDGQWSGSTPVCRDGVSSLGVPFATCAITSRDDYTLIYRNYQLLPTNSSSRFPHGTELQARCKHIGQYTFHGSSNLACLHGHWTGPIPYCTPNGHNTGNFTPMVDFRVEKGQYLITPDGRLAVRPGSKVIFTCRYNNTDDWFLYWVNEHRKSYPTRETDTTTLELIVDNIKTSDAGEFSCLNVDKVGRTTVLVTVEDWRCPQSDITSENLILVEEDNHLGGRAVFRCARGFTMEGSKTSVCQIGGKWYPPSPVCKGSVCPCFAMSPNLIATIQRNDRSHNAYFTCIPGYRLVGLTDITCTANGTWSHPTPTCIEIDCGSPPGFNEGRLIGNRTTLGGIYYYWCDSGVIPEDSSHFTKCQADGTWSHVPPSCLEVRCNQTENDCFTLNCTANKQYLIPRDKDNRHWGCCGETLYDMRTFVCEAGQKALPCTDGFPCENGNCVSNGAVCNGINDCSDGTDERGCGSCDGTQFKCRGGQCIDFDQVCDRAKNCYDGTDETGCSRGLSPIGQGELGWCGADQFTCSGDRMCLPLTRVCDGQYDCDGGYDEEQCGVIYCNPRVEKCRPVSCPNGELAVVPFRTRYVEWGCCGRALYSRRQHFCSSHGVYPCPVISFRCHNGNCVPPRWQCDSENDCSDGTDEAGCHGCPAEEYNCGDRQCVHVSRVCDKVKDCYNGMDECHCARSDGQWCGGKHYRCANDKCIDRVKVCDHIDDCGDKSDEVKCTPED